MKNSRFNSVLGCVLVAHDSEGCRFIVKSEELIDIEIIERVNNIFQYRELSEEERRALDTF